MKKISATTTIALFLLLGLLFVPGCAERPARASQLPATPTAQPGQAQRYDLGQAQASTDSGLAEQWSESDASTERDGRTEAAAPVPTRKLPPIGIVIPTIGVNSHIVEIGTRFDDGGVLVWETAAFAVGHHSDSANPGEPGNIVLTGHISSRNSGAVFKRLPDISEGDPIVLYTGESHFLYRVTGKEVVLPGAIEVAKATEGQVLTLITCVPDGVYTHRLVVRAVPVPGS